MVLSELTAEALKLSPHDRLALAATLVESLHDTLGDRAEQFNAIRSMCALLQNDQPIPTAQEVDAVIKQRRMKKYL